MCTMRGGFFSLLKELKEQRGSVKDKEPKEARKESCAGNSQPLS